METADSVHALLSTTGMLDTAPSCPASVVNWSTYTGCAIPDTIGDAPLPTRNTAMFVAAN